MNLDLGEEEIRTVYQQGEDTVVALVLDLINMNKELTDSIRELKDTCI